VQREQALATYIGDDRFEIIEAKLDFFGQLKRTITSRKGSESQKGNNNQGKLVKSHCVK